MREAEAVRARGLAEAESAKARAEALAAFDGVAQRVELTRLTLDAQVRIEIAKAQALGTAMAAMNIKLIGDPAAAVSLLRMVTLADGLGEVVKATPEPVLAVGQQLLNKLTADPTGASLLKLNGSNGHSKGGDVTDIATVLPELLRITEQTLDINQLKGKSVREVMSMLAEKANDVDKPLVLKAQTALEGMSIIADLPFEDVYQRATAKGN